jgi:hypothetical protein
VYLVVDDVAGDNCGDRGYVEDGGELGVAPADVDDLDL